MGHAAINGRPVTLNAAVAEAARLLGASRLPVIAGLGTDIAGARAAIALARRIGGAVDHMHSGPLLRDLDVMRESGMLLTTPSEAQLRADIVLLVGDEAGPPELLELLSRPLASETGVHTPRRILWLGTARRAADAVRGKDIHFLAAEKAGFSIFVAALRARVANRAIAKTHVSAKALDTLAADLKAARFGVAVWSGAELNALTVEMLCGLVDDLNAHTRFAGLPLAQADDAHGVLQACGWLTGFPMRIGFGRGYPEHDPWRFDASRLAENGEADSVVWISAYRPGKPAWQREVPTIAITGGDTEFRQTPNVHIAVGTPGIEHDAVQYSGLTGGLVWAAAASKDAAVSVADVLNLIMQHLPELPPC